MLLSNRVAIITGGAKGIGRSIALKFADEGCSIAIADINDIEANKTAADISKKGVGALATKCDVTNSKQVNDMVTRVIAKFGKIDILVNDAGGLPHEYVAVELPEAEWDKVMNLNLKSDFLCCKAALPHMMEKKYGKIINMSSVGANFPVAPGVHYSAAKAGVLGLTYDLAYEYAAYNICVNAIMPGPIRTAFWDGLIPTSADKDAVFDNVGKSIVPLLRVGTPEDIAGAALFLASELSSYVTGVGLIVAGGMPLKPSEGAVTKV
jgi:NAD(P)-dependent dehydrogenase (short-subunit alcohol dehydrogenase family)